MDWIDYREKLGFGFNDEKKVNLFYTRITNVLGSLCIRGELDITPEEYFVFCEETGSRIQAPLLDAHRGVERFRDCFSIIQQHESVFIDYLSYFVWFINCIENHEGRSWNKAQYQNLLIKCLDGSHIQYDLLEDGEMIFVFPKGAEELDDALVSQPLEWMSAYPQAQKTFIIALKQYSDGIYIRDVADNLRKALEAFFQEFLGNTKNLETNKNEICKYLGAQGIDAGISGLYQPLINAYKNVNDRIAKHNDAVDKKFLEFLLYQTGLLIRMVIVVSSEGDSNEA